MSKAEYIKKIDVTQLSDGHIIQLKILKFIDGISKNFILNLSIDEKNSLWGNRMVFFGIIMRENSHIVGIIHHE